MAASIIHQIVKWPKIILFGDSITQHAFDVEKGCWGALLANRLERRCDVISRGFSGYNTRWCKLLLPQLYRAENISEIVAFVIYLGANDCCMPTSSQHVPIDEYVTNLGDMIDYLQSIGLEKTKVILMTPPPYNAEAYEAYSLEAGNEKPLRESSRVQKYAEQCKSLAESCGVDCADIYGHMIKQKGWEKYLCDGLHLSKDGAVVVDELLWNFVQKKTSSLPLMFPLWSDVDTNNLEESLKHKRK